MIYLTLFGEFFKIGFFAVGGGLTTIPFLFEISEAHQWFTRLELTNYVALVQALPGPIGMNLAVLIGNAAGGFWGGIVSALGLTLPSFSIAVCLAMFWKKHKKHRMVISVLEGIRSAGTALVLFAAFEISKTAMMNWGAAFLGAVMFYFMLRYRTNPVVYVVVSAISGVLLGL